MIEVVRKEALAGCFSVKKDGKLVGIIQRDHEELVFLSISKPQKAIVLFAVPKRWIGAATFVSTLTQDYWLNRCQQKLSTMREML